MPANGTTALDTLNWGTGVAETTSTLGVDRQDLRSPPDSSHLWGAQINASKNLLLSMSQYFKGGARLQVIKQGSNPFGAGESGVYIDNSGTVFKVVDGTPTALAAGTAPVADFSATDIASANTGQVTDAAGSFTYGVRLVILRGGVTLTGLKFWWPGGHGSLTVKCALRNNAGSTVASQNVAVNAANVYSASFGSQALTAGQFYDISVWENSGARNIYITAAQLSTITGAEMANFGNVYNRGYAPGYLISRAGFAAGDAAFSTFSTTDYYGIVDPVF